MKNVLRSPFSVLRSPFSVLRSPFSVLVVICLFCFELSAQTAKTVQLQEPEKILLSPCGNAANFDINKYISNPIGCCAQFTVLNFENVSELWEFGDGSTSDDAYGTYHCYAQSGTYLVKHTVTRDDGSTCSRTKSVTIIGCDPCPQIQGIQVVAISGYPGSYDPNVGYISCVPTNLTNPNQPDLIGLCSFKISSLLSSTNSNSTYKWEIFYFDYFSSDILPFCQSTSNQPNVFITTVMPGAGRPDGYNFFALLTITTPNCPTVQFGRIFNVPMLNCQGVSFGTKSDSAVNALKQLKSTSSGPKVYPNPVLDILRVSNLKDDENYTFDIRNTLGQTVLTQKVSSIEATIDVSNLTTGVYISVLKSQGKIISTNKIYKK